MPFTGYSIHRFGSRTTALTSGLVLCALLSVLVLAPTLSSFIAVLFFVGVSNGHFDVSMNSHSVAVQDRFERPILSAVHGWFSIGGFAGGASSALAARLDLSDAMHLARATILFAILLVTIYGYLLHASVDPYPACVPFVLPVEP